MRLLCIALFKSRVCELESTARDRPTHAPHVSGIPLCRSPTRRSIAAAVRPLSTQTQMLAARRLAAYLTSLAPGSVRRRAERTIGSPTSKSPSEDEEHRHCAFRSSAIHPQGVIHGGYRPRFAYAPFGQLRARRTYTRLQNSRFWPASSSILARSPFGLAAHTQCW